MARPVGAIRKRFATDIFKTKSLDERGSRPVRDRPSTVGLQRRGDPSGEDSSSLQSRIRTRRRSYADDAKAVNRAIYEESNRRTAASIRPAEGN
ncbi:hypothetical protein [Synechococcus elongatus]|uniref:hypothetical protein n=1 Tax=Synechococcus elongatus TaxID=32046 RepID=UPI000F7EC0B0|nr:hypothetical protein [Synechococcus elongatus]